ncbi:unnamed protein product [Parnassius apollo]|uniref:(apollo) hypothetical protein n=1 Tax=Parnassius apollo TaxID=110799 RepID=A0A8S3XLL9_PARAO|nr:unnamed protein product [Parnassius apollo]
MYRLFVICERVTEQRVMDQKRQILRTCKIATERLEQLKTEVAKEFYPGRDVSEDISAQEPTADASSEIIPDSLTEKEISKHTKYDPPNRTAVDILDTLRQKLAVKSNRLKRYRKSRKRREDNALFTKNEKLFYQRLQQSVNDTSGLPPRKEEVEKFWRSIWSEKVIYNETATRITREEQRMLEVPEMQHVEITEEDITQAVYKFFCLRSSLFYTNQWRRALLPSYATPN